MFRTLIVSVVRSEGVARVAVVLHSGARFGSSSSDVTRAAFCGILYVIPVRPAVVANMVFADNRRAFVA